MKANWLLCITASLLLAACGSRTRDIPQNAEFVAMVSKAQELSDSAEKWNLKCGNQPPFSKDCQEEQKVMSGLWSEYIIRALKYKDSGTGHNAVMRTRVINFNMHIALFNVKCAGQEHNEIQEAECQEESGFIEQERTGLHQQMVIDSQAPKPVE